MAYSVATAKTDLSGILHGTQTNQITGLDNLINRAARQVLADCDPQETIRITPITNAVFNSIYDYPAPADLKGTRIIDIRPQANRQISDVWNQLYNQYFDLTKGTWWRDSLTVNFNAAVKTLRLNAPNLLPPTTLNTCESTTTDGTWTAGSSASNIATDNVNFVANSGSISFDLAASGSTGYLENLTMSQKDISDWLNQGTLFLWTYLPTASNFTNVILRWGSSSSAYYSVTATTTQQGNSFANGWNLLKFTWLGATVTGSPSSSAIDYLRVTWTYDGTAQTGVRLDNITAALGTILEIEYYSKYMFRDASTGAFQETVAADTDLINLDTESYNLMLYKIAELAVQQQQGVDALQYDGRYFADLYKTNLDRYTAIVKSQVQKPQSVYYGIPGPQTINPRTRRGY